MEINAEEIQDWTETIQIGQNEILSNIKSTVTTFYNYPDTKKPDGVNTADYLEEYAIKIVSELEKHREIDEQYKSSLNSGDFSWLCWN